MNLLITYWSYKKNGNSIYPKIKQGRAKEFGIFERPSLFGNRRKLKLDITRKNWSKICDEISVHGIILSGKIWVSPAFIIEMRLEDNNGLTSA
jgi:hypothetical protein